MLQLLGSMPSGADVILLVQAEVETKYAAPKELHGFELVREHFVQEYDSQVLMYRHKKTGKHLPAACAFYAYITSPVKSSHSAVS